MTIFQTLIREKYSEIHENDYCLHQKEKSNMISNNREPVSYPTLEQVDALINNVQDLNELSTTEDLLVPAPIRKQQKFNQKVADKFEDSFVNKEIGHAAHEENLRQARVILQQYNVDAKCRTLPPLFTRYIGPDLILAVQILPDGELVKCSGCVPDLILNFSGEFHTIVMTLCHIDRSKLRDYNIVQRTLYAMDSVQPVDLERFQRLYDVTRYAIMKQTHK